jgi:membrane protein YqaA with SNARE-associated domain
MTLVPLTTTQPSKIDWQAAVLRSAALLSVIAVSVAVVLWWDLVERLGVYGYPAVFIVSLLSSATFLLPAPGVAFIVSMGAILDPVMVGVVAGLGAAIGELTAYAAGYYGNNIVQDKPLYQRIEKWMRRAGGPVIFILAAVPNPVFDIGGLIAGVSRMPAFRFLLLTWLGKSLRYGLLAGIVALAYK